MERKIFYFLVKLWFSIIGLLLIYNIVAYEVFYKVISIVLLLFSIYLIFLFDENKKKENRLLLKVKRLYAGQLKNKEKEVEELKRDSQMFMKSALKRSNSLQDIKEKFVKLKKDYDNLFEKYKELKNTKAKGKVKKGKKIRK